MKKCLYLLVSALCFLLLFCPSSNASMSSDLVDNIRTLEEKGLLNYDASTKFENWFNNSYCKYYIDSGYPYCIGATTSTSNEKPNTIGIFISNSKSNATITNNNTTWNYIFNLYYNNFNWSNNTVSSNAGGWQLNNTTWKYFYTPYFSINTTSMKLNAGEEYGGNYLTGPSLVFTPATTKTINITANNVTESFYNLQNSRNINYWRLGSIQGALDVSAVELNLRCIC